MELQLGTYIAISKWNIISLCPKTTFLLSWLRIYKYVGMITVLTRPLPFIKTKLHNSIQLHENKTGR